MLFKTGSTIFISTPTNTTGYAGHRVEFHCTTHVEYAIAWFLNETSSLQETGEPYRAETRDYEEFLTLNAVRNGTQITCKARNCPSDCLSTSVYLFVQGGSRIHS